MSKSNKPNQAQPAPAPTAVEESAPEAVIEVAAPAVEPVEPEVPAAEPEAPVATGKYMLRSIFGPMYHPFVEGLVFQTNVLTPIDEIDSWTQSQIDEKKIEID